MSRFEQVLKVVDIARQAMEKGASDVHLTVSRPPMLRIYGKLHSLEEYPPLTPDDTFGLGNELMTDEKTRRMILDQGHTDFSSTLPGVGRVRVNIYLQRGSYAIAIRIIPMKIPDIEELGLPPAARELLFKGNGSVSRFSRGNSWS